MAILHRMRTSCCLRDVLKGVLDAHHVPEEKQGGLFGALEEANAVPELAEPAHVMAKNMVRAMAAFVGHPMAERT